MHVPTTVVRTARSVLPVVASGLVLLLAAAALPDLAGLALVAGVTAIALLLQCGVGESLSCRLLVGARSPTAVEATVLAGATTLACRAGLGPPVVQLRVQPRDVGVVPYAWGAGIVVVPRGLVLALHQGRVSPAEAAAGLCHAGATSRAGLASSTAALTWWCLPWSLAASFLTGLRPGPEGVAAAGGWRGVAGSSCHPSPWSSSATTATGRWLPSSPGSPRPPTRNPP